MPPRISDRLINLPMCNGRDTVEEFKSLGGPYRQNLTPLPSDSPAVAAEKASKNYIISTAGMRAESLFMNRDVSREEGMMSDWETIRRAVGLLECHLPPNSVAGVLEQLDREASKLMEDNFATILEIARNLPPKGGCLDETGFLKVLEMCEKAAARQCPSAGGCVTFAPPW